MIASIGVSAGAVWAIAPWTGILGVTFFGATAVVAVGAWRAGVIPGRLAAALVVALSGPTALYFATMVLPWYVMRQAGGSAFTFFGSVMLVWPLVGAVPSSGPSCRPASCGGDAAGGPDGASRAMISPTRRRGVEGRGFRSPPAGGAVRRGPSSRAR